MEPAARLGPHGALHHGMAGAYGTHSVWRLLRSHMLDPAWRMTMKCGPDWRMPMEHENQAYYDAINRATYAYRDAIAPAQRAYEEAIAPAQHTYNEAIAAARRAYPRHA